MIFWLGAYFFFERQGSEIPLGLVDAFLTARWDVLPIHMPHRPGGSRIDSFGAGEISVASPG